MDDAGRHLLVRVKLIASDHGGVAGPKTSGYRPAWEIGATQDGNPVHTSGRLVFPPGMDLAPGAEADARLYPMTPESWDHVAAGQDLRAYEGSRLVATAIVLDVEGMSPNDP